MLDPSSTLKRKVIDTVLLILDRNAKDDKAKEDMLQIFSADPYSKITRKMGRTHNSIGTLSDDAESPSIEPLSPVIPKRSRKQRLVTA